MAMVEYKVENSVGYITLNVPEKLNALVAQMKAELLDILREVRSDPNVRAVVITGAGRAFCAGGDLSTMGDKQKNNEGRDRMRLGCDWVKEFIALEKPVIAAVNGYAFGAGMSIALLSDFIVCSEKASFQASFVNVGLAPDSAHVWALPKRVGLGKAKELTYFAPVVKAPEALEIGLADKVVAPEELMDTVKEMAEKLANGPTYVIGLIKTMFRSAYNTSYVDFLETEANLQAAAFHTQDHVMAVKAFLNKEEKVFTGK